MHTIEVLKSNLFDNNGAWILVSVDITVVASPAIQVAFMEHQQMMPQTQTWQC